jgi:hypothetical protein
MVGEASRLLVPERRSEDASLAKSLLPRGLGQTEKKQMSQTPDHTGKR